MLVLVQNGIALVEGESKMPGAGIESPGDRAVRSCLVAGALTLGTWIVGRALGNEDFRFHTIRGVPGARVCVFIGLLHPTAVT